MTVRLYDWGPSPFCLKIRAILEYKGVPYERSNILGPAFLQVLRHGIGKVPALDLDGRFISDSTDIAHALEERTPDPPILPSGARARARCHVLEDWADEALYFVGLYLQWVDPKGRRGVPAAFGRGPAGTVVYRLFLRRILRQVVGQGTGRKTPDHVARDLERHLEAAAALLRPGPYLLGEAPMLCDFALMGQMVYLSRTPVGGARVAARPALGAWLARMRALRA